MQEACMICGGSGRRDGESCAYCNGQGRLKVHTDGPHTVLMATGSCKVPVRKVTLTPPPPVQRLHTA